MKYLLSILCLFLLNCDSDDSSEVEGCTDETATNYNEEATVDDDSCAYPVDSDGGNGASDETTNTDSGNSQIADGCNLPANNLYLMEGDVIFNSSTDIAGFQFNIDGTTASGASGGAAADAGFTVSTSGSVVLGFSFSGAVIPAGCGTLTSLDLNGDATGLSDIVIADPDGESVAFEYYTAP